MVTVCSRIRLLARHNLSTSQPFHLTAVGSPSRLKQMSQTHESAAADEAGMREYESHWVPSKSATKLWFTSARRCSWMRGGQNKFATKAHRSITCRSTGDLLGWCRSTFSSMRSGKKTGVNAKHFTRPLRPLSPLTHDMRRSHQISPALVTARCGPLCCAPKADELQKAEPASRRRLSLSRFNTQPSLSCTMLHQWAYYGWFLDVSWYF